MESFSSSRTFRIWDYHVSLSQLLIRSPRDERDPESNNIDLIFRKVFYIESVYLLQGIEVGNPTSEELEYLESKCGVNKDSSYTYYVLSSSDQRYYVVASYLSIEMNKLKPMETSLENF